VNNPERVWALGFSEKPPGWPDDRPFELWEEGGLPPGPVVVHRSAVEQFIQLARQAAGSTESGRLPQAVLYLPLGDSEPPEAVAYFDAVVTADETDRLARLLACPQILSVHEWAEELPREALFGALDAPWEDPNLSPEAREHLATCQLCRDEFQQAVQFRRRLLRALCPEPKALASYARGTEAPHVARHVERCPACRAEVAVLRRELVTKPRAVPLGAKLQALWERVAALTGLRQLPPLGMDLSPLLGTLPLAAAAPPETQAPQSLQAQLEGLRCTVQRFPGGDLWAFLEAVQRFPGGHLWAFLAADLQAPRRVRLVLASPKWAEPKEQIVELRQIAPDRLGATLFLGRADDLDPEAALFLLPEPMDA
jgi:hypothetical protein